MNGFVLVSLNGVQTLTRSDAESNDGRHQVYIVDHHGNGVAIAQYVSAHECRRQAAEWARIAIECDHADLGTNPPEELAELVEKPVT